MTNPNHTDTPLVFKTEMERLRFFIAGLAAMNLNAPKGKRPDVHHAQMLREIRNAARHIIQDTTHD